MTPPRPPLRLDPATLAAIADLEFVARVTVDGAVSGLHRSPFHGYSAEFTQYRHYRPGDDLKYVDWKLLARTDRIYTKQYRETTNLAALLVVDASRSMAYQGRGGVAKIDYARLLAAGLAHLFSRQGEAVGLALFDDALRTYVPPRTGPAHSRRLLVALRHLEPQGRTAAAPALRRAIDLLRRRGLLVLLSDLYDEDEQVEREIARAVRIGHEVALFHILTRDELALPFTADVRVEDMESGRAIVTGGGAADAYARDIRAFLERWRRRASGHGLDYALVVTDTPLDVVLRSYLLGRRRAGAA